ncbi:tetratricopeptide repeat protein [Aliikangiella maris]|uniref:Tetratricopeptide repeat protein n=2 Tax=Aliikangiella maris TaxID=3162458 RepID=A0ABV3MQD5_9GAMM
MSLINQVLRDLENNPVPQNSLKFETVAASKRDYWPLLLLLFICVATSVIIFSFNLSNTVQQAKAISQPLPANFYADNYTAKSTIQSENILSEEAINSSNSTHQKVTTKTFVEPDTNNTPMTDLNALQTMPSNTTPIIIEKTHHSEAKKTTSTTNQLQKQSPTMTNSNNGNSVKTELMRNPLPPAVKVESQTTQLKKELAQIKTDFSNQGFALTFNALLKLLNSSPDFHPARQYLLALCQKNTACDMPTLLEQTLKKFPQSSRYRLIAAKYFFEKKLFSQAESYLLVNMQTMQNRSELLQMRALTRQKLAKHNQAIADYNLILREQPRRGDIYLAIGISFDALGQFLQAKQSFQNALTDKRLSPRQQQFAENKIISYRS